MNKKLQIPQHTKWGIRVTAIIILLLTVTILRNCIGSFHYGITTEQEQQKAYYELGYSQGRQKAQGLKEESEEPKTDNLLLRKLYRKGYRDGWDSVQTEQKAEPDEKPSATDD